MKIRIKCGGFVIIDVLMALIILLIGVCAVSAGITQWMHADKSIDCIQTAAYLAQDGFEKIRSHCAGNWTLSRLQEKSVSENLIKNGNVFERVVFFRARNDLDASGHLIEAKMLITWTHSGKIQEKIFVTYFAVDVPVNNLR